MATGDINGDGLVDVLVGGVEQSAVLMGTTAGLAFPTTILAQGRAARLGDLNHDGHDDAVLFEQTENGFRANVFHGSAAGLDQAGVTGCYAESPVSTVTIGDVTGDGLADIVMQHNESYRTGSGQLNNRHRVVVCSETAAGAFETTPYTVENSTSTVGVHALVDLDGDPAAEILLWDPEDAEIQRWDVSATLTTQTIRAGQQDTILDFSVVDMFGRGRRDLLALRESVDLVFPATETGFGPAQSTVLCGTRHADLNGDERPDFVGTLNGDVCLSMSAGAFTMTVDYATPRAFPVGRAATRVALVDLNRDGRTDILTLNPDTSDIAFVEGR